MKFDKAFIQKTKKYKTPFLVVDGKKVAENYLKLEKNMPDIDVFYSVKANDDPRILKILAKEGCSFEIASPKELRVLIGLGVSPEKIVCFHTIKTPEFLKELKKNKIKILAYDSFEEIDKIAKFAPGSEVVLRIVVNNEGSEWPLTKKFGIEAGSAMKYLKYAKNKGLKPIGLTCHVGSQCMNKNNWISALYEYDAIWEQAKKQGMQLTLLSLGGGLPVKHLKAIPTVEEIAHTINPALKKFKEKHNDVVVTFEPGRGLVGDTAIMVTSVIGHAKREKEDWIYIDLGVFNGLMETIEGFMYEIKTENSRKKKVVTVGGPSCDSVDIPFKNISIPEVKLGERLYLLNSGAYTTVYAAPFNGFDVPEVYVI
jgi:ornithine decarboxylase